MRNRLEFEQMPRFWPPRPSGVWDFLLTPLHRLYLRGIHGIVDVRINGWENISRLDPKDGILLCPNHSYTGDGSLMAEFSRRSPRRVYIMAAWHGFRGHFGLDGWLLQHMGAFSVDREGCDRRAIKQAVELLTTGRALCIFPEGEIYHLNERITPLRDGVAFIAATAQRDLDKSKTGANVWIVPVAIRYSFVDDITPALENAMSKLEHRLLLTPMTRAPLHERIIRFGEMALTIREKQFLGHEQPGDLPTRINRLMQHILSNREQIQFGKNSSDQSVPVRVKLLRQNLIETIMEENADPAVVEKARAALADVHLALQLYSYPGDYISSMPTTQRMAETIEKFEEDIYGTYARPKGNRRATILIGDPINVKEHSAEGRIRTVAVELTQRLEASMWATLSLICPIVQPEPAKRV